MLVLRLYFPEKIDADYLNETVCTWLQGSPKFIDNEFIVSPVICNQSDNKTQYLFDICLADGRDDIYKVELRGGTIGLEVSDSLIWAFVKETNE